MPENERRLAAIMFTDMVGYTALTQSDESLALQVLVRHNRLIRPFFAKHNGKEIKAIGDSFMVEFKSGLDATNCAVDIQSFLHDYNLSSRDEWKVKLRIGIHLGDVVHQEGDIFGDAVNLASRLQSLADPEGICLSDQVFAQVGNKVREPIVKAGLQNLKNVKAPMEVYKVVMPWEHPAGLQRSTADTFRVAVLPFTNLSPDPGDEYFANGMTEELIDRLAQLKSLRVIARSSVMKYRGSQKGAGEVAKELNAGALVEGSVRMAGDKVRVTVQLVNGGTEEQLWSSRYDSNLGDLFDVQSEIANKVAGELKVQILEPERRGLEKRLTGNVEAYSDFLRGRELFREGSQPSWRRALGLFEEAVRLDSDFARAYVGIAACHQFLAQLSNEDQALSLAKVRAALDRALELDPDLPEAHASRALMLLNEDDMVGAEDEGKTAVELNPSLPEPYRMLFEIAAIRGEPEEMLELAETAYRLDPVMPQYILLVGDAYLWAGRDEEMLEHCRKTEHLAPPQIYRVMTEYHLSKGEVKKARESYAKFEDLLPTHPWAKWMRGFIEAREGNNERALTVINEIEEADLGPVGFNFIAYVRLALGDLDSYFENINRALELHSLSAAEVMYSPLLAVARKDPRYEGLVAKLRRQTGLEKAG